MKTIKRCALWGILTIALSASLVSISIAQNTLAFTAIRATDEGAIHLEWASQPNEVYQIQCAGTFNTNTDGTTAWQTLYDRYPSQGTNTFWLDTGNYLDDPIIPHPKYDASRFYRIVDEGADTASDSPILSINSPTNGTVVSDELTITVNAITDQGDIHTKLYVDGQEMPIRSTGTNYYDGLTNYITDTYVINTCEWGNGPHILFATAETFSTPEGGNNVAQPSIGHGVSPFIPVTFSNLITRVVFSQYFFDPDAGQTQQVSSVLAANSDWTITVVDVDTNAVISATGSGNTLQFSWDGNDTNGIPVPAGVYYYVISAQTNGLPDQIQGSGSGGSPSDGPPAPSFASASSASAAEPTALYVISPVSNEALPLAIYPPGFDTNGLTLFEASPSEMATFTASILGVNTMDTGSGGGVTPMYSGAASQGTIVPKRPPTVPAARIAGTVGIGYQRYLSWTNNYAPEAPKSGLLTLHVPLEGVGGSYPISYHSVTYYEDEAKNLIEGLQNFGAWKTTLNKVDGNLTLSDLRGSGSPFNQVNLAMLLLHGTYGSGIDYTASNCKQMYFPIQSGGGATYLRMSEMSLGGAGTNGLKWVGIMACYSLKHDNWANMQSLGVKPYNSNLHLLLGCDTTEYANKDMLIFWARYINWGIATHSPMEIRAAWYQAAKDAYAYMISKPGDTALNWAVAGDSSCYHDMIQTNYTPTGTWFYEKVEVWHP